MASLQQMLSLLNTSRGCLWPLTSCGSSKLVISVNYVTHRMCLSLSMSVAQPLLDLDIHIRCINDALTLLRPHKFDSPAVFSVFPRYTKTFSHPITSYYFNFPSNHGI